MKKSLPHIGILSCLMILVSGVYLYYLKRSSQEIVENWMRIEEVSIQQGNIFSSLASSNRILMTSGLIKSVMLYNAEHGQLEEMASYGEYLSISSAPDVKPGSIQTKIAGPYRVLTFVRLNEKNNLLAVFAIENPGTALIFGFMLFSLIAITIAFSIYIGKLAATEEEKRFAIVNRAMEDLVNDSAPSSFLISEMPHMMSRWDTIQKSFAQLRERLEDSARDRLIAQTSQMLGHDLRAPLGTFERLLHTPASEFPAMKSHIRQSLNRIYSMIEALRNYELESFVHRSKTIFTFAYGYQALRGKAEERGIDLRISDDPPDNISIDKEKFERVWLNLTTNAIEFARSFVSIETRISQNGFILRVIDDGSGVPEEIRSKLFHRGATAKPNGTGLGLAYAKQIMLGHGGDITYKRENGLTVFECVIPDAFELPAEASSRNKNMPPGDVPRRVAILTDPESLGQSILGSLMSRGVSGYEFSTVYADADIVISNQEEVLERAMDDGKASVEIKTALSLDRILLRLEKIFS